MFLIYNTHIFLFLFFLSTCSLELFWHSGSRLKTMNFRLLILLVYNIAIAIWCYYSSLTNGDLYDPYFLNICILVNRISMYIFNGNEFIFILFLTIMTHVLPLMILYVNCYLFSKIFKKHSINIIFIGYNILVFEIIFLIHEPSFCLVWER